jgi:hypothetical protein
MIADTNFKALDISTFAKGKLVRKMKAVSIGRNMPHALCKTM